MQLHVHVQYVSVTPNFNYGTGSQFITMTLS